MANLTLVLGTRNPKKKKEIEKILADFPLELKTLADYPDAPEVEEDKTTFEGNACKKALETANALGQWVIADDSGLEVDALGGRPGVFSARYAGPNASDADLCRKVLEEMKDVPDEQRTARFRTVIALAKPNEVVFTAEGVCEGVIAHQARGSAGFGYDPIFYYPSRKRTFAEMSGDEKNSVSHRGRALEEFKKELDRYLR